MRTYNIQDNVHLGFTQVFRDFISEIIFHGIYYLSYFIPCIIWKLFAFLIFNFNVKLTTLVNLTDYNT